MSSAPTTAPSLHDVTQRDQNYINHVVFVIDASGSMSGMESRVVNVMDAQLAALQKLAVSMQQETRITVYAFSGPHQIWCVHYDRDVRGDLSLKGRYHTYNTTALVDATLLAMNDLGNTPEKYGDHSYLIYVITDGEDNTSKNPHTALAASIKGLPDNWTMACLVPHAAAAHTAKQLGFPAGNVMVWDTTSSTGLEEMSETVVAATTTYFTNRSKGVRSSGNLFTVDASRLSGDAVKAANLTPLDRTSYVLVPVVRDISIKEMVEECTTNYQVGTAYYQLNSGRKPNGRAGVIVQGNKNVIVVEKSTNRAYSGAEARQLIGLPDHQVTVNPMKMDADYDVYVQSTSLNRKLFAGTRLLLLTGN